MSYREMARAVGPVFLPLGLLARLPYAMTPLGTLILLQAATGSYAFAGAAAGAQSIAIGVGGVLVGAVVNRYGLRRVGAVAAVVNAVMTVGLIAASQAGRVAMFAAAAVVGLSQPQVGPLVRVHWAWLFQRRPGRFLTAALSYEAAVDELGFVVGLAVVGLLAWIATPIGPVAPLAGGVVLLLGASLPFALLYTGQSAQGIQPSQQAGRYPRGRMAGMFVAMAAMGIVFGAVQIGVTAYAAASGNPGSAGLLYAELGVGSALAGVAYGWLPQRFTLRWRYPIFAAGLTLGMTVLALGGLLLPLPVAIAIASLTISPYMIAVYAATERLVPPQQLAFVMMVLCAGGPVGVAAGQVTAGWLADTYGSAGAFALAPAAACVALLLAAVLVLASRRYPGWLDHADRRLTAAIAP